MGANAVWGQCLRGKEKRDVNVLPSQPFSSQVTLDKLFNVSEPASSRLTCALFLLSHCKE